MRQPRRWTKVDDDGGVGSGHARDREVAEMVEGHRAEEGEGDIDDGGDNEHVDKRGPRRDGRQRRSRRDDDNDDGEGWIASHLTDNGDEWCKDDVGDDSLSSFSSWASAICDTDEITFLPWLLQFPVQSIFWGDFSRRRRDLSLGQRNKSRFMPLHYSYRRLLREDRENHCHTSSEHQAHPRRCRRRPSPPLSSRTAAVVSCRRPPAPLPTCRRLLRFKIDLRSRFVEAMCSLAVSIPHQETDDGAASNGRLVLARAEVSVRFRPGGGGRCDRWLRNTRLTRAIWTIPFSTTTAPRRRRRLRRRHRRGRRCRRARSLPSRPPPRRIGIAFRCRSLLLQTNIITDIFQSLACGNYTNLTQPRAPLASQQLQIRWG